MIFDVEEEEGGAEEDDGDDAMSPGIYDDDDADCDGECVVRERESARACVRLCMRT